MDAFNKNRIEELAREIAENAQTHGDLNQLMQGIVKSALQKMLNAEMDVHLGRTKTTNADQNHHDELPTKDYPNNEKPKKNRRNGRSRKTIKGDLGEITIETPRDRNGTFEPQLIPKHQRRIPGFDEKIMALYAKGMTTRDIQDVLHQLYGVDVSATLISEVTSAIDEEVKLWQTRPLDSVWPIVYLDGIVVHVRGDSGHVSKHTIYVALGVNLDGHKELLGLWLSENEGAKFWLNALTDMKNRGLQDIFVICIDGLPGFSDAIQTAYPETKVQLCVVHLVRAALRYVTDKDKRAVARDLKSIYNAPTLAEAEEALEKFSSVWDEKYPTISKTWRSKWSDIITLFEFPWSIRKAISTTNTIESLNSVIRKLTRNRKIYPSKISAIKHMYIAIMEASKKWSMPIRDWKSALNHFAIIFEDRLPKM